MSLPVLPPGQAVLAFDVGGTSIKAALVDELGIVREVRRSHTPLKDPAGERLGAELSRIQVEFANDYPEIRPTVAGVSVPGLVDESRGIARDSTNLGWRDLDVAEIATRSLGLPVAFGHDVRSAALAEASLGAARGYRDAVVVMIGTGISAAMTIGGSPHTGDGYAGEIGHLRSRASTTVCACGLTGCLETVSSGGAIGRRYEELTGTAASAEIVLERALAGDEVAERIWDEAIESLAESLSSVIALLAPEVIVVGGGLAQAGKHLFEPLRARVASGLRSPRPCAIVPAELGDDAGVVGAALNARALTLRSP